MNIIRQFQLVFSIQIQSCARLPNKFKARKMKILFLFSIRGKRSNMTKYFISKLIEIESSKKHGIWKWDDKVETKIIFQTPDRWL